VRSYFFQRVITMCMEIESPVVQSSLRDRCLHSKTRFYNEERRTGWQHWFFNGTGNPVLGLVFQKKRILVLVSVPVLKLRLSSSPHLTRPGQNQLSTRK
jgi:hypothetical protein